MHDFKPHRTGQRSLPAPALSSSHSCRPLTHCCATMQQKMQQIAGLIPHVKYGASHFHAKWAYLKRCLIAWLLASHTDITLGRQLCYFYVFILAKQRERFPAETLSAEKSESITIRTGGRTCGEPLPMQLFFAKLGALGKRVLKYLAKPQRSPREKIQTTKHTKYTKKRFL